jgi:hypothetical protein
MRRTPWLVIVPCAVGIAVAGAWVGHALWSPSRHSFGKNAATLAFLVACLVFRLFVDLLRFRRTGRGLAMVAPLSATLVVVLALLAGVLNGLGVAGIVLVGAALLAIPLSLAAWVLSG